jgi:hypothetical protein
VTWSILNAMMHSKIEALFADEALRADERGLVRAMSKDDAMSVIHAALWAYSSRAGSTASAYAFINIYDALGLETWTFKKNQAESATEQHVMLCVWEQDADSDFSEWHTSCGQAFCLNDGPPSENDMRFCCYCGKRLMEEIAKPVKP